MEDFRFPFLFIFYSSLVIFCNHLVIIKHYENTVYLELRDSANSGWNDFGPSLCQIEQFTHGWLSRSHTEKPAYDASEEALKPC
ncbi:MAG: hypothetical protein ACLP51_14805, partial [Syntrophobacteraceae bacterium]